MSKPISMDERRRQRAEHSCVGSASSMQCRACNTGKPYPSAGDMLDEILDTLFPQRSRT